MSSYRFGSFTLDAQERRLLHNGQLVPLTPKVFDTLVYLVERQGHLVEKEELMQAVWRDSYVEDGNLPRTIHILRKALANGDSDPKYIETVPTKGYRFIAEVTRPQATPSSFQPAGVSTQPELGTKRSGIGSKRWLFAASAVALLLLVVFSSGWGTFHPNGLSVLRRLKAPTESGAAYTKYQSGRLHLETQHPGDYEAALADFESAINLDPHFAGGYAGKADAELFQYWETGSHDDIAQARLAVSKAIEIDPNNSYAHVLLCRLRATYDWDFAGAQSECRHAVDLEPQSHEARRELAFLLNSLGKRDEALQEMDIAVALAPTSFNKRSRGLLLYFARRYDEAIMQLKQVEATDPEFSESSRWIARCLEQKRDYDQALAFLLRFRESNGAGPEEIGQLRQAFANGGWPEVLRASLPKTPGRPNLETAGTFAQLGENDKAFAVLDGMVRDRRVMIAQMDSDPRLDPLRSDPRFEQLAKRVGLR